MAGHSKFKNIMYRKGAQDKKRGKIFSRLGREITVAVKMGGGSDPASNSRLRAAFAAARAENMPKENIERAIKKGSGQGSDANFEEIRYEGYGSAGIAIMVETMTDNRNRTAAEIRSIFNKNGGSLGETGSVEYLFSHMGEIRYPATLDFDALFEAATEANALDVSEEEDVYVVTTAPDDLHTIADSIQNTLEQEATSIAYIWQPSNLIEVSGKNAESILNLIDVLDNHDDVQQVTANFDIPESEMAKLNL